MGGHHRSVVILDFFIFCLFLALFWSFFPFCHFWSFLAIFWPFLHIWGIFAFLVVLGEPVSYEITRGIREDHLGGLGGFGEVWGVLGGGLGGLRGV